MINIRMDCTCKNFIGASRNNKKFIFRTCQKKPNFDKLLKRVFIAVFLVDNHIFELI